MRAGDYVLVTAHRAGNVDDPARLRRLVDLLLALPMPAVVPLHPRTRARLEASGMLAELEAAAHVRLQPPLGYLAFTALLVRAQAMLTDSGGVQKEAYLAGVPCVTMRDTTEWVETVEAGWNVLVDLDRDAALAALARPVPAERPELYGDGRAGERVVAALERAFAAALAAAEPQQPDARGGERRRVQHPAAVDDDLGAGQRVRAQRAVGRVVGLQDRAGDGAAVPRREPERAQLAGVVERVGHDDLGAVALERVAQREGAGERRLLDVAAVGDAEHEHAAAREVAAAQRDRQPVRGVGGHAPR